MAGENDTRACKACGKAIQARAGRGRPRLCCQECTPAKQAFVLRSVNDLGGLCVTGTFKVCEVCCKAFWAIHNNQRICGPDCYASRQREHAVRTQMRRAGPRPEAVKCTNPKCSEPFSPAYGDLRRRYCSAECRMQHKWQLTPDSCHRRRARRFGSEYEAIDPIRVFERDGWQCQLCRLELRPADRGTHKPEAPELDHIIPLAAGGTHTWANVQCACRACNIKKGANVLPMAA